MKRMATGLLSSLLLVLSGCMNPGPQNLGKESCTNNNGVCMDNGCAAKLLAGGCALERGRSGITHLDEGSANFFCFCIGKPRAQLTMYNVDLAITSATVEALRAAQGISDLTASVIQGTIAAIAPTALASTVDPASVSGKGIAPNPGQYALFDSVAYVSSAAMNAWLAQVNLRGISDYDLVTVESVLDSGTQLAFFGLGPTDALPAPAPVYPISSPIPVISPIPTPILSPTL